MSRRVYQISAHAGTRGSDVGRSHRSASLRPPVRGIAATAEALGWRVNLHAGDQTWGQIGATRGQQVCFNRRRTIIGGADMRKNAQPRYAAPRASNLRTHKCHVSYFRIFGAVAVHESACREVTPDPLAGPTFSTQTPRKPCLKGC